MAGQKRTDNKGRILKDGESQRKDGSYRYRYTDANGVRHDIYSSRLVATDRTPKGCKEDLSLREKERKVIRDLEDGIKAKVENNATLNDLFNLYISGKTELKDSTRSNYIYMYRKYAQDSIGKRKIASIKYSEVKAYYNSLIEHGFKPNSMEIMHTILHPVFTLAVRDGYIRVNPTDGVMAEIKKSHNWEKPTSLSKAFNLISRFSEDIDLILDWRVLGYGKDEPWKKRSNTKQDAFNEKDSKRIGDHQDRRQHDQRQDRIPDAQGESVNAFINRAIDETMERDTNK